MSFENDHVFWYKGAKLSLSDRDLTLTHILDANFLGLICHNYRRAITTNTTELNSQQLVAAAENEHISRKRNLHFAYINISHKCNLRCKYCFAGGGGYGGKETLMDLSMAHATVDWLFSTCPSKSVGINFFGGEPLENEEVLTQAIAYAQGRSKATGKRLRIIVSTNGTHPLTELGELLRGTSHTIVVSIDGPARTHNANRPFRTGRPSFDTIATNVHEFLNTHGATNIVAKATWRPRNFDLLEIAECLRALGLSRFYVLGESLLHAFSSAQPRKWLRNRHEAPSAYSILKQYDQLFSWYCRILDAGEQLVIEPLHSLMKAIESTKPSRHRCLAGTCGWCVTPSGDIFPCHRFVGREEYIMGNVLSVGHHSPKLPENDVGERMASPPRCRACWARHWCFQNSCVYESLLREEQDIHDIQYFGGNRGERFCTLMQRLTEMACYYTAKRGNLPTKSVPGP
ncbi:MAG: SPASM domain-containing protein [bacterium]|nr:SPASM domain-containing protein [bacterium]